MSAQSPVFDDAFRRCCEALHRARQHRSGQRFLTRPLATVPGGGTEAVETHDYHTGDDFRYIDWNRCARHDELVSRQFPRIISGWVHLLVDNTGSMANSPDQGSPKKLRLAQQLAGVWGYLALANGDRVTLDYFASEPAASRQSFDRLAEVETLFAALAACEGQRSEATLNTGVDRLLDAQRPSGLVMVMSDLFDAAGIVPAACRLAEAGHTPFFFQILAPHDARPAWRGRVTLGDANSDRQLVATLDADDLACYAQEFSAFCDSLRQVCRRANWGFLQAWTNETFDTITTRLIRL